ncbi:MAG: N-6 DNA methylase [Clostridia bacterium]|nr:N-6 DNA methylase [Clostridia bacterium]
MTMFLNQNEVKDFQDYLSKIEIITNSILGNDWAFISTIKNYQVNFDKALLLDSVIKSLNEKGKLAILQDVSCLFAKDSEILRNFLFENDYVDAIIALPNKMLSAFDEYAYLWILNAQKEEKRKGKVQLIDATCVYHKLENDEVEKTISNDGLELISKAYFDFVNQAISEMNLNIEVKICNLNEFECYELVYSSTENGESINEYVKVNAGQTMEDYFKINILPNEPNAKINYDLTKRFYEIDFSEYFKCSANQTKCKDIFGNEI